MGIIEVRTEDDQLCAISSSGRVIFMQEAEKIYLVTGAAGHLGGVLVRKLISQKEKVRILVLPGEQNLPKGNVEVCYGDVRKKESLSSFFNGSEEKEVTVIHCAGIVSIASKYQQNVYDVNVIGTKNIVDLCMQHHVKKLIYVSSVHAIPEKPSGETIREVAEFNPRQVVGLYAKTKSVATAYVLKATQKGLDASVVHPSGITGPYDPGKGHITTLVMDYYKRRLLAAVNGGYDFVDVRDVVEGIIACCKKGKKGACYILSNQYYPVADLLYQLHEITGKKEIKVILPLWFVKWTAPLAEQYYKLRKQSPLFTTYSIFTLNTNAVFSHEKATRELGYQTRDMKQTLADTVHWLEKEGRL
ncbi:MAG: NAD-dependent epimerase/dehydratase family protein [Lachnospiraceae bacterium]